MAATIIIVSMIVIPIAVIIIKEQLKANRRKDFLAKCKLMDLDDSIASLGPVPHLQKAISTMELAVHNAREATTPKKYYQCIKSLRRLASAETLSGDKDLVVIDI